MADLSTKLLGLDFPNPVWPAAGPTVRNGELILRQVAGGAGGIVCKTISSEAAPVAAKWLEAYFAVGESLPGLPSPVLVNGRGH